MCENNRKASDTGQFISEIRQSSRIAARTASVSDCLHDDVGSTLEDQFMAGKWALPESITRILPPPAASAVHQTRGRRRYTPDRVSGRQGINVTCQAPTVKHADSRDNYHRQAKPLAKATEKGHGDASGRAVLESASSVCSI